MFQYKAKEIEGSVLDNLEYEINKRRKYENKKMLRCTHSRRARF